MISAKTKLLFFISLLFTLTSCYKNETTTEIEYLPKELTYYNQDYDAYLSPDGENIVFYSTRFTYDPFSAGILYEIWQMDRDGKNQRLLIGKNSLSENNRIKFIKWGKTSDYIIVLNANEIWKVSLDGEKKLLHTFEKNPRNIEYSPDENKIAFSYFEDTYTEIAKTNIYLANADFSSIALVDTSASKFSWANDSKILVYAKYEIAEGRPYNDIWKHDTDKNVKERFSNTLEFKENISCSKQNNLILFTKNDSIFYTAFDEFSPRFVITGKFYPGIKWVNNRNLILLRKEQSQTDNNWFGSGVIVLEGNLVKDIAPGAYTTVNFSKNGHYYLYTIYGIGTPGGGIWIDFLP